MSPLRLKQAKAGTPDSIEDEKWDKRNETKLAFDSVIINDDGVHL
jgi:hypothetical protein